MLLAPEAGQHPLTPVSPPPPPPPPSRGGEALSVSSAQPPRPRRPRERSRARALATAVGLRPPAGHTAAVSAAVCGPGRTRQRQRLQRTVEALCPAGGPAGGHSAVKCLAIVGDSDVRSFAEPPDFSHTPDKKLWRPDVIWGGGQRPVSAAAPPVRPLRVPLPGLRMQHREAHADVRAMGAGEGAVGVNAAGLPLRLHRQRCAQFSGTRHNGTVNAAMAVISVGGCTAQHVASCCGFADRSRRWQWR